MIEKYRGFIGQCGPLIRNEVEKGAIRAFARAIGETNPLYFDEDYAAKTKHKGIIAPPTFARVFDFGEIPGLDLPPKGRIHAEQEYEYYRVLRPGDVVYCQSRLLEVFEKKGQSGTMVFVVMEQSGQEENGEFYFKSQRVSIIPEILIKGGSSLEKKSLSPKEMVLVLPVVPSDIHLGDHLGPVVYPPITKLQLVQYAGASGDFNPIHTVEEVALEMGLGGVIAHGMLIMAYVTRLLCSWADEKGTIQQIKCRFHGMVYPNDIITVDGVVLEISPHQTGKLVSCELWANNQNSKRIIAGKATVLF